MTERGCYNKYPQQVITKDLLIYRDKIVEVIIHDTIIIKADTIMSTDTVYHKDGLIWSNRVYGETDFARAWAQVQNSKLKLEIIQKDTAITRLLKENVTVVEKEVYKTETVIKKVWVVHWYDTIARVVTVVLLLLLLALIVLAFIKGKFNSILNIFK